jgi:UDP-N-acetylglucosamine 2-epimerase (non-hydrolysing)
VIKVKIVTILGTRPEIIRLSLIIQRLDKLAEHVLVHTGQNYEESLNDIFFKELDIRKADYFMEVKSASFGEQIAKIMEGTEKVLKSINPDKVLLLGDTNSCLSAIIAERMGIPVYHLEAGNRCFDLKVPEEVNRKIIDSVSSHAIPYTPGSRENLLNEGIHPTRIFVSGNPIYEVLHHYADKIEQSDVLNRLKLEAGKYFLITAHRAENVDVKERLMQIFEGLEKINQKYGLPVICSIHPRTKNKLLEFDIDITNEQIRLYEPFGFFDFVKLEKNALCVLTDSGTVQEECCIFHVPTVTVRDSTERPETVQCGSNIISGVKAENIFSCTQAMLAGSRIWKYPEGYVDENVSEKVAKHIMGESLYV